MREIAPDLIVKRRKGRIHARAHRIARSWQWDGIIARNMRARSLGKQIDAVGESDRLFEIMGDQKHTDPLLLDQARDILNNACTHDGIERGERLVHEQKLWREREHLRERDALNRPSMIINVAEMVIETK